RSSEAPVWPVVGGPAHACLACQVAPEPSGSAAARRADRLARPRHRRPDAQLSRGLPAAQRLHDAPRFAQHERGRTHVQRRDHAARGQRRRPGIARRADRPLWPRDDGGSVPRHRTRRRRAGGESRLVKASALPMGAVSRAGGSRADPRRGVVASLRRIRALIRRHAYLLLKSWPRLVSMMYYPTVTMVLWAFVTIYLAPTNRFLTDAPGFFIGAVLLWDVLFRGQLGVSLTFIEEVYARNLGNLFVSPLRLHEFIAGQLIMSVLRTLIGVGGACLFAWLLFRYSIFTMGLPLVAFFTCLLAFGWAIGLAVSAMILRYGLGAEDLEWAASSLVERVSGVYYPIAVLPPPLQAISWALPPAYVFEGMRAVLLHGTFRGD